VPAKPPQIALKRTNNGIGRAYTVFSIPFLPSLRAWTGIPKHCCRPLFRRAIADAESLIKLSVDKRQLQL
jgi:hypothetical protein